MAATALTPAQEAHAQERPAKIHKASDKARADRARLLVSQSDRERFGPSEFQVPALVLRSGAKVYREQRREQQPATTAPA